MQELHKMANIHKSQATIMLVKFWLVKTSDCRKIKQNLLEKKKKK